MTITCKRCGSVSPDGTARCTACGRVLAAGVLTPSLIGGVLGSVIAFLGTFPPWQSDYFMSHNAWNNIPFAFIWDRDVAPGNLGLGLVITVIAIAGALLSLLPVLKDLRVLAGLTLVGIAIAFAVQYESMNEGRRGPGSTVTLIGGVLLAASPFMRRRKDPRL